MSTYFTVGSVPRDRLGNSQDIKPGLFIELRIDYRTCGSKADQFKQLNYDFDKVSSKAGSSLIASQVHEVHEAFHHYVQLIKCGYIE